MMEDDEGTLGMHEAGDGQLVKMEVDYSADVDKTLPNATKLAQDGKLSEALDMLYTLEKKTRLAADMKSNRRVLESMCALCYEAKDYTLLNDTIGSLTKKRSLLKQAITRMVQQCCKFVDEIEDETTRIALINKLRDVTSGKIYVEAERARLTSKLAKKKEGEGLLEEAKTLLLDLQVETYGSLEIKEKVQMLLEQMRLCLETKDYSRAQIISKKISIRFFNDTSIEVQEMKIKFYRLMIQLDQVDSNYLNICRHYHCLSETPLIMDDVAELNMVLKNVIVYLLLAPHDNESSDMMHRLKDDKVMEKMHTYRSMLELFTKQELISWAEKFTGKAFGKVLMEGSESNPPTGAFDVKTEEGRKHWQDLERRVCEHNIRMIDKYYSRITLERLSQLLGWDEKRTEQFLCEMVVSGVIPDAKIDRSNGIVVFETPRDPVDHLNEWGYNHQQLLHIIDKMTHLIQKEEMVQKYIGSPVE